MTTSSDTAVATSAPRNPASAAAAAVVQAVGAAFSTLTHGGRHSTKQDAHPPTGAAAVADDAPAIDQNASPCPAKATPAPAAAVTAPAAAAADTTSATGAVLFGAGGRPLLRPLAIKAEPAVFRPSVGPSPVSPAAHSVMHLYSDLVAAFAHEKALGFATDNSQPQVSFVRMNGAVQGLLSDYARAARDWVSYAHFNDLHYVRNLVESNDAFELMVICWRRGQASRVHNHGQSHCWLTVLDGQMTEVKYHDPDGMGVRSPRAEKAESAPDIPGVIAAVSPCPELQALGATELQRGDVSYISDRVALHAVRCSELMGEAGEGEGGVTLHLYAPPIRRVTLYEPDLDRVVERIPGFFTIKGQRT